MAPILPFVRSRLRTKSLDVREPVFAIQCGCKCLDLVFGDRSAGVDDLVRDSGCEENAHYSVVGGPTLHHGAEGAFEAVTPGGAGGSQLKTDVCGRQLDVPASITCCPDGCHFGSNSGPTVY